MKTAASRLVVVATSNAGKLREIRVLLEPIPARLCSLAEVSRVQLPDEGVDYASNAEAKAVATATQLGELAVADDSGLEVEALNGAPGPLSARYGGEGLDDAARSQRLLRALEGIEESGRRARFVCLAALSTPDGRVRSVRGVCEGRIIRAPRGDRGFGYDPIFRPDAASLSMAELEDDAKHRLSHRGQAFGRLRPLLLQALREC